MSLSNLSSAQITTLIRLVKQKESAQAKVDKLTARIEALESGSPSATAPKRGRRGPGRPPKSGKKKAGVGRPPGRRSKRLKAPLLKALQAAGATGITVKELAEKLKVKPGNVFSWFYTTGKKVSGIKKVGEARYAYTA
jgi:uncharacterized protein YjcR